MNNEPVAWIYKRNDGVKFLNWKTWKDCEACNGEFIPLYTAPQGDGCGNCHACLVGVIENHMPVTSQRMIVCSDCGNKRCPKASNHRHKCTGSNEVGQYGSIYTAPRELSDEEIVKVYQSLWKFLPSEEPDLAKDIKKFARALLKKASEK